MVFLYQNDLLVKAVDLMDNRHSDVDQVWTAY